MPTYKIGDAELQVVGSLDLRVAGDSVRPTRLPDRFRHELPSAFMRAVVDTGAGIRLRFATEAVDIAVFCTTHRLGFADGSSIPAVFDLVVDGVVAQSIDAEGTVATLDLVSDTFDIPDAEPEVIRFDSLAPGPKLVEVWLPHTAVVDIAAVETDAPITAAAENRAPRWVHHGSSISHCLEALSPTRTWPARAASALGFELWDLAYAGQAMLDPFVARTIRDLPTDLISLKLGINLVNADVMRMRAFGPAVHGFLDTIREGQPLTPIVLISPILCPAAETAPGPTLLDAETGRLYSGAPDPDSVDSLTLTRIRAVLSTIVGERAATDANLYYLDGRSLFDEPDADDGHLPDGLHPDDEGYRRMGERFARLLPDLLDLPDLRASEYPGDSAR